MQNTNLIVLGHGSKSKAAIDDFNFIVDTVKSKSTFKHVMGAHMEMAKPSLQEVIHTLVSDGERHFVVFPYFLFNGVHIREDIPSILADLRVKYADITIDFAKPIGQEPQMADIILSKIAQS